MKPQVPAWRTTPPRDPEAIETAEPRPSRNRNYDIRSTLRVLFNSDFFKECPLCQNQEPG